MRDVVSLMVYFWFSITENHENHSRDILVQAIDNQANWISKNRIRPRSKETMIEDGAHLSENIIKLLSDILVDRSPLFLHSLGPS